MSVDTRVRPPGPMHRNLLLKHLVQDLCDFLLNTPPICLRLPSNKVRSVVFKHELDVAHEENGTEGSSLEGLFQRQHDALRLEPIAHELRTNVKISNRIVQRLD